MSSKRIYFNLFLIVLFGLLIRITCLDKPEGLWNDEYISWYISSKPLFSEFINEIYSDKLETVYLAHLSIENNTPELALSDVTDTLSNLFREKNQKLPAIKVLDRYEITEII